MNNIDNNDEIKIINIQLIALIVVIVSTILSILTTYNQKLNLEKKETIFNSKEQFNITIINRVLSLLIAIVFLYVNYKLYKISKSQNEDLKSYKLQILASTLTVISGIIILYVVKLSNGNNISDIENPII